MPHRTAEKRYVAPAPLIEPAVVCGMLTGNAQCVAKLIAVQQPATMIETPANMPAAGNPTMNEGVCIRWVPRVFALQPAFATRAPAYPPISACDELEGMP